MNIVNKVTLKTLGKNKVRTLVTIIGIILSVAMITAVTTGMSSLENFIVTMEIERGGDWYGAAFNISSQKLNEVKNNSDVSQITSLQNIGYALLEDSINEYKPYIFIGGMDTIFAQKMPVDILEGRLPENSSEIILPDHLKYDGGVEFSLDETILMKIGERVSEGYKLIQIDSFLHEETGGKEELVINEERTYKVVGFYERADFEDYSAPGYTALTVAEETDRYSYDAYLKVPKAKTIYAFMKKTFPENLYIINNSLLRYTGQSNDGTYNLVLYNLAAVLIGIIVFGSISLIYNAFSISVSERTKQFGLLSSIGATRHQMKRSVLFEAFFLSIIGIPLGILAGILGIGVTFKLIQGTFQALLGEGIHTELSLYVSWNAVIIAATLGLATVLISAYIPARRAFKVSAIDSIRLSQDIRIKAKKLKTPKFVYRLFGVEGMIAQKNFRRSKKKYRATVVSLFLSIVLFISASSFSAYLTKGVTTVVDRGNYDIRYTFSPDLWEKVSIEEVYNELKSVDGVTDSSYSIMHNPYYSEIAVVNLSQEYKDSIYKNIGFDLTEKDYEYFNINYFFMNDEAYEAYLEKNSLDKDVLLNSEYPLAIVVDYAKYFDGNEERYYTLNQFDRSNKTIKAMFIDSIDGYYMTELKEDENHEEYYEFMNSKGDIITLPKAEAEKKIEIKVGAFLTESPMGGYTSNRGSTTLVYPYSALKTILEVEYTEFFVSLYFNADNHKEVYEKMYEVLDKKNISTVGLFDYAEMTETDKAFITVINVFSYGFIVLISLIAAANVFNTISTNIGLRRREFAMLKSIGMTQKMFNRMMNYECLFYGIKALIYGLPVSIGVTYLIYKSVMHGLEIKFFIPWYSLVIAVGSVFTVVFATMIYAMKKIKKDNPIDALKDDNI